MNKGQVPAYETWTCEYHEVQSSLRVYHTFASHRSTLLSSLGAESDRNRGTVGSSLKQAQQSFPVAQMEDLSVCPITQQHNLLNLGSSGIGLKL